MTWQFVVFANQTRASGSATWMLRIPTAPVWAAVALILGISAVLQIVSGWQNSRAALRLSGSVVRPRSR